MGISPEIKIQTCLNIFALDDERDQETGISCFFMDLKKLDRESRYEEVKLMAKMALDRTDINSANLFKWLYKEANRRGNDELAEEIKNAAIEATNSKIIDDHTAQVDVKELKFSLSALPEKLAKYLATKTPLEQARILVVLQEFRPKIASQLQFHIDISEASNIVAALNERLFISRVDRDRDLTGKERAIAKYFILRLLNTEAGTNLKGKHYNGWINIRGVSKDKDSKIINMTVDIDQSSRAPREVVELISKF